MTWVLAIYVATVVATGGVLYWLVNGMSSWRRRGAVLLLVFVCAAGLVAIIELLSRPKPINLEIVLRGTPEAEVLAHLIIPEDTIYLWLRVDGVTEPRAYGLPWTREAETSLRGAQDEARENQQGVRLKYPFERSWEFRQPPVFYAPPQPKSPEKTIPDPVEGYAHPDHGG